MTTFKDIRQAKVIEEERRLEELMFGSEQDKEVLGDDNGTDPDESSDESIELTPQEDPFETARENTIEESSGTSDSELASLRKELADEKYRFGKYKGSTDKTIYEQRQKIAYLNEQIIKLREAISAMEEAQSVTSDDGIPEEVIDILGEDTVSYIKEQNRKTKEEIARLKKEREEERIAQAKKERESQVELNNRMFYDGLSRLVPDYEKMNVDKGFIDWLSQPDQYGLIRIDTMRADQSRGDYIRVAQFFNEYKEIVAKKRSNIKPVDDSIHQHIGPKGSKGNSSSFEAMGDKKGYLKMSEINEFNRQVAKGKFKYDSAKAEAMEARIFKATKEGKIIFDVDPNF